LLTGAGVDDLDGFGVGLLLANEKHLVSFPWYALSMARFQGKRKRSCDTLRTGPLLSQKYTDQTCSLQAVAISTRSNQIRPSS
jgi:hypothetical protein